MLNAAMHIYIYILFWFEIVEIESLIHVGFEPIVSGLQSQHSTAWAISSWSSTINVIWEEILMHTNLCMLKGVSRLLSLVASHANAKNLWGQS